MRVSLGSHRAPAIRVFGLGHMVPMLVAVIALLSACGGGGDTGSPQPATTDRGATAPNGQPFIVQQSAYTAIPNSPDKGSYYVEWVAVIKNPNDDLYGTFPSFTITATDASGSVIGTDDQVLESLPPGATEAFAGQIGAAGKPSKVTVEYSDINWYPTDTTPSDYPPFAAKDLNFRASRYDSKTTGVLVNPYGHAWGELAVTALYYDESGMLLGGSTEFVDNVPAKARKPMSVSDMTQRTKAPPSVKIMAMPWGGDETEWNHVAAE